MVPHWILTYVCVAGGELSAAAGRELAGGGW